MHALSIPPLQIDGIGSGTLITVVTDPKQPDSPVIFGAVDSPG